MVRIRQAKGGWKDLDPEKAAPERFQRTDGSRLSEAEISAIAKGEPGSFVKHDGGKPVPHRGQRSTDAELEQAWKLATEHGQTEAARIIGLTQGGIQGRLVAYQKRHGLTGPLPGKRTPKAAPEPPRPERHRIAGVYEPLEEAAHRDNGHVEPEPAVDAAVPLGVAVDRIDAPHTIFDQLREHGFELVIRLRQEVSA